jgi:threonine/homoserine/homoserine lactone efflux protein
MAPYETLLAFAVASGLFAFIPGPAMLYSAAQTLARGRRAGFMAVAGLHVGCYAHVVAAALGLSFLFAHVPEAFLAVKIVGALYLVWLGVGMIRGGGAAASATPAAERRSTSRAFAQSVAVEVLNPKTALFFIAFLPQFVDPAGALPVGVQFIILGTIVNLMFTATDVIAVMFASVFVARLKASARAQRIARWLGGSVMIGLGVKLATERGPA